jgi:hypothetical protein
MVSLLQTDRIERLARPRGNVKAVEFWSVLNVFLHAPRKRREKKQAWRTTPSAAGRRPRFRNAGLLARAVLFRLAGLFFCGAGVALCRFA